MLFRPYHIVRTRTTEQSRGETLEFMQVEFRPLLNRALDAEDAADALRQLREEFPTFPPGFFAVEPLHA